MKKKLLCISITLAMILTFTVAFSSTVFATEEVTLVVTSSASGDTAERADGAQYQTITGALAKAEKGDTIKLETNVTENVTVGSGKDITLDLNGCVLKNKDAGKDVITNNGILTLKDSTYSEGTATGRVIGNIKGSIKLEHAELADQTISVDDNAARNTTTEGSPSYDVNNAVWFTGSSDLTNVNIEEKFGSNNTGNRVRGIRVAGNGTKVNVKTEEGKTSEISFNREKVLSESKNGWSYGISLGAGDDNASMNFSGKGDLKISGNTTGGGDDSSPYGYSIYGIEVNGADNSLMFSNEGKTTITESGAYGVNALVNYGKTKFSAGKVLLNSYIDGGVAYSNNTGLCNKGKNSKIEVTDDVNEMTVFTEGAAYYAAPESGDISNGAEAIYNASYGEDGKTVINAKKLNVFAVSGEDTLKEWEIGDTKVTGHTKYSADKAKAVGEGNYSTTYGIKNEGKGSIEIGADTETNIKTRDFHRNSVAVGAVPYEETGYIETNGSVSILGNSKITAEGDTGTLALYAAKGNSIEIGSEGKSSSITGGILADGTGITTGEEGDAKASYVKLKGSVNKVSGNLTAKAGGCVDLNNTVATGEISVSEGSTLNLANTSISSAAVSNEGTIIVDMSGATEDSYTLIDYTGSEAVSYGTEGENYKFAEGKDCGYKLKVYKNDLYAYKPVMVAQIDDTKYETLAEAIAAATEGQTVKMIADSQEAVSIAKDKNITLDLNDHVLKGTGSGSVISNHGTLTIKDGNTTTEHYFTYSKNGAWTYIPEPTGEQKNSAVTVDKITDSTTIVKVTGGIITGGNTSSNNGGGILTYEGSKLTVTGGTVCGNSTGMDGGGIYTGSGVSVTLKDAVIVGNHANAKAGGFMLNAYNGGSLTVGGTVNISGNTAGVDSQITDDNLTLWVPQTYTGPITIDTENTLKAGSKIHLSLKSEHTTGAVTTANSADYSNYFKSDNSNYKIYNTGSDQVQIVKLSAHEHIWNYGVGRTTTDNDTLKAWCSETFGATGNCTYNTETNADKLTIVKPAHTTYEDAKNANATLVGGDGEEKSTLGPITSLPAIKYEKKNGESWEKLDNAPTDAGTYKASITIGSGNDAKTAFVEYIISRAKVDVPGGNNYTYDGTEKTGVNESTLYTLTDNKKTKAGNYTAKATLNDKNNYEWNKETATTDDQSIEWIISPIQLTVEGTTAEGKTYDGNKTATPHIGTVKGKVDGDAVEVTIKSATFEDKNAGTSKNVTVTYEISGSDKGNYTAPVGLTTVADIEKKSVNVSADNKTSYVGSNLEQLTYTADELCADDAWTGALETNADKDKVADNYTITQGTLNVNDGNEGKNYTISFTPGTYTVTAKPTPTPDPQPEIVVPVSGDEGEVSIKATIDENNAKIETITVKELEKVGTGENVTIDLSEIESQGKTLEISEVTLTTETVENIKESPATGLEIKLSTATVIIDQDTLSAVADQATGNEIKLVVDKDEKAQQTLTEGQKEAISEMNEPVVLDAYFISNGTRISDFRGGTAKVLVEYPTDKPIKAWFVADNGDKEEVKSEFDKEKQIATFEAKHFSHYVIESINEAKEAFIATGTAKATTNTIKWNAVEGADGYDVYYAKCGNTLKKVKSTTALKYTKKGLNKKKYYKYRVKAYETVDGNKVYLATSPVIHIAGVSAKYSNATKVTADPDGIFFEVGDTDKITAKITKKSSKKTVLWKNHVSAKIRYMSTDSSVVTVDSKGNVTAIDKGEAYVYAYAASGAFAKITVTVQ